MTKSPSMLLATQDLDAVAAVNRATRMSRECGDVTTSSAVSAARSRSRGTAG
jgi:hypothetical protein